MTPAHTAAPHTLSSRSRPCVTIREVGKTSWRLRSLYEEGAVAMSRWRRGDDYAAVCSRRRGWLVGRSWRRPFLCGRLLSFGRAELRKPRTLRYWSVGDCARFVLMQSRFRVRHHPTSHLALSPRTSAPTALVQLVLRLYSAPLRLRTHTARLTSAQTATLGNRSATSPSPRIGNFTRSLLNAQPALVFTMTAALSAASQPERSSCVRARSRSFRFLVSLSACNTFTDSSLR